MRGGQYRYSAYDERPPLLKFFTKITTLFGEGLRSSLSKPISDKRRNALLELFRQIKTLDLLIGDLIENLSFIKSHPKVRMAFISLDKINDIIIPQVHECLFQIRGHLEYLAPGFEIMAEEAATHIMRFSLEEDVLVGQLELILGMEAYSLPGGYQQESIADYESQLNEVQQKGELARKSLADFIRQEYTWATLGDESNLSNVVLPPPVTMKKETFVHIAILTIREDEYEGVRGRLSNGKIRSFGPHRYLVSDEPTLLGQTVTVSLSKLVGAQGDLESQRITDQIITDLSPKWVILSGIAGAVPDDSFSLFDVIVSTGVYDLTVQEVRADGNRRFSITGGNNLHDLARSAVEHLSYYLGKVPNWHSNLGSRPSAQLETLETRLTQKDEVFGAWNGKIRSSIARNFGSERLPKAYGGAIASASTLVKDAEIVMSWLDVAKHIVAIDMEAAGVFAATRGRVPALVIRGVSDIVGLRRAEDYNNYAASAAGALAIGLINSGFFGDFGE
jgi:nucleoside phosphorylase